ncbi:MAG: peptidyl-prolyl cis-trans isomerase, partial [Pyrinomonadaceae bacterium]|nr:peptidyl-prolyl cis-trans isomerase [Pyrinomonadaceae bacterium]
VTPIKEGFALPVLVDKKDARDADFEEVKDKVIAAAKIETAKTRLEQTAKDLANNSNTPDALKAAATKIGLKAADSLTYKLGSPLGEGATAATSAALDEAIYNLKPNEITKNPIKAGDNYYVVGLVKRTDADMQAFAKQRDDQVESALSLKKGQVFTDYLADLRQRFEKEGRIKIEKTVLAKLNGATATDEG